MSFSKNLFQTWIIGCAVFGLSGIFLFFGANWSAYQKVWQYQSGDITAQVESNDLVKTLGVVQPSTEADSNINDKETERPDQIEINRIQVIAPVIWDTSFDLTNQKLSQGVVHIQGTAYPGQVGNSVIFGHSSDYFWRKNPYATVFTLLPKLKPGDSISIQKNGQKYNYQVQGTKVVSASDLTVLNQSQAKEMTLITCYPLGTTLKRFMVRATLVD